MKRNALIVIPFLFLFLAASALAQQSNKSKSKDRYREKELPPKSEIVRDVEQTAGWTQLAAGQLRQVTFALSEVMLHDMASPPAASRFYAYSLLAGYQTASRYQQAGFPTMQGTLNGMPVIHSFTAADSVFFPFAALWAILETGKGLLPSGYLLAAEQAGLEQLFRDNGLSEKIIAGSQAAARAISGAVMNYAATDGYTQLTASPRTRPTDDPSAWQPTSPDRMTAIDPNWNTLRPFFLESAQQFRPAPPVPFSTDVNSPFMALAREVYDTGRSLTPEQRDIALFWEGNLNKMTPGTHWMNICGLACEQQKRSFREGLIAHTALALTLNDVFISCWDEKFRGNRLRPVTAINRALDANWQPLLETPAYPEYISDNSMASAAAAEVLTHFLGDNRAFTDDTPIRYGLKPRAFRSFRQAAGEASVSGLYGGIHFRDAVDQGLATGRQIGVWTLRRLPVKQ